MVGGRGAARRGSSCGVDVGDDLVDLLGGVAEPAQRTGIVWLTIDIVPPPTSFFVLTSPRSGSMPVVSQSIIRPMVLWLTKPLAT